MAGQRRYPPELRERVVQMYRRAEPQPVIRQMARQFGVHPEALRNWIRKDEGTLADKHPARRAAQVQAASVLEPEAQAELDALRLEVMELRRANGILLALAGKGVVLLT